MRSTGWYEKEGNKEGGKEAMRKQKKRDREGRGVEHRRNREKRKNKEERREKETSRSRGNIVEVQINIGRWKYLDALRRGGREESRKEGKERQT